MTRGRLDPAKLVSFRYDLWTRMCTLADEAMSIADAWWESDPELVELHYRRCGSLRQMSLYDEDQDGNDDDNGHDGHDGHDDDGNEMP
jgi:hypothetical protein